MQTKHYQRQVALSLMGLVAVVFVGCGAPVKSATDVASIFDAQTLDLQGKVNVLCKELGSRSVSPKSSDFSEGTLDCSNAGLEAQNFKKIDRFSFVGVDTNFKTSEKAKDVRFLEVRSEVWLNSNLLDLAGKLSTKMKTGLATGDVSLDPPAGSNDGLANLVKAKVEVLEKSQFDQKTFEFSTKIRFLLEGAVKADHVINVAGKMLDNKFAISAVTEGDQVYEKSILKNFQAIILVVPHAGDVYLDLSVKISIYDVGLGDQVMKDNVHKALSTGLKSTIDSFLGL